MTNDTVGSASEAVQELIRALGRNNPRELLGSYRAAFRFGSEVSGAVENYLLENDWSSIRHGGEMRYLSGMVGLLHDVDESACESVVRTLLERGCSPATGSRLRGILSVVEEDFRSYCVRGVEIRESRRIAESENVEFCLERWLRLVPEGDLGNLERLYVVPYQDQSYAGTYTPGLFKVLLVWRAVGLKQTQRTLYHEIGHHVCRHRGGFDLVQEEEAESYASKMMVIAHPIWGRVATWLAR